MIKEIEERRSVRKFLHKEISDDIINEIIVSGIKAPSAKNRQPWKFIVVQGGKKEELLSAFAKGIEREEAGAALLPESRQHLLGAKHTLTIMKQAPVIILVINREGNGLFRQRDEEEQIYENVNVQSIGAAIENMLLAATEKGLGSLWICDLFFAYQELNEWMDMGGDLLAAVALGYPGETPHERPRKKIEDVVLWIK